jgi:predicted Rossmann-fold nucleotide-binding protein
VNIQEHPTCNYRSSSGEEPGHRWRSWSKKTKNTVQKRFAPILNLLNPQTIQEHFGTENHRALWKALNTNEEHRNQVFDWLDTMITTQVEG